MMRLESSVVRSVRRQAVPPKLLPPQIAPGYLGKSDGKQPDVILDVMLKAAQNANPKTAPARITEIEHPPANHKIHLFDRRVGLGWLTGTNHRELFDDLPQLIECRR